MLDEIYNKVETAGQKLLGFAPHDSLKKARIVYKDIINTDDYSKQHLTRILNDVTMMGSGNQPMVSKSVKIEPIIEDDKRYNLIDAAYALYKANVSDGKSKKFSFTLATCYMLGRVEMEFLKIPLKGINVERDIDFSKRSPVLFLLKNYFIWIIRAATMAILLYHTTSGNLKNGNLSLTPAGGIVLGFSFWVTFSVFFWNLLLLFKIGKNNSAIPARTTVS